jgi:hypothetical protein
MAALTGENVTLTEIDVPVQLDTWRVSASLSDIVRI